MASLMKVKKDGQWVDIPVLNSITAESIGAKPANWMPTAEQVGATPAAHTADKANPHGVTTAQIGAAPAGYGYGGVAINLGSFENEEDLTAAIEAVYANMSNSETKMIRFQSYPSTSDYNFYGVLAKSSTNYGSLHAQTAFGRGTRISKAKSNGVWQPLEWENPPLQLATEYRTTERYQGKPVYVKLINIGALPNSTSKTVNHNITVGTDETLGLVSYEIFSTKESMLAQMPIVTTGLAMYARAHITTTGIVVTTNSDASTYTAIARIKYTKS